MHEFAHLCGWDDGDCSQGVPYCDGYDRSECFGNKKPKGPEMTRSACLLLLLSSSFLAAGPMGDGGASSTDAVQIELRNVAFDGRRLVADVRLIALRDVLFDVRLDETLSLWPDSMATCSGTRIPVVSPVLPFVKPSRGQELLLKEGYKFERPVALEPLRERLEPETCVDIVIRLRGAVDNRGHYPVLGRTTLRIIVASNQD